MDSRNSNKRFFRNSNPSMDNRIKMKKIFISLILAIFLIGIVSATITGSETMTRTLPSTVNPSSTFTVTYTAIGTSGSWGASIVDSVSGGCKFPSGGTLYQDVMLSDAGTTRTVQVIAPSSGSCTFTGDYKYGDKPTKLFTSQTVSVCVANCVRPSDLCLSSSSNGCGGTCSWAVQKNSNADLNCDNQVSRDELGSLITKWVNGQETRDNLGSAIQAWA